MPGHTSAVDALDHLVYATPELSRGIAALESATGVRAVVGGRHPGRGTRNAIIALGGARYLEIIAPDEEQPTPDEGRWLGVDACVAHGTSRLTSWAAKGERLSERVERAASVGLALGPVRAGSRQRDDGTILRWELTDPEPLMCDGVVPFLIDWGQSAHPTLGAPGGLALAQLRLEHPDASRVAQSMRVLGIDIEVRLAPDPAIVATITGPRGTVVLR